MIDTEKLRAALASLDDKNDGLWIEGKPRISAVRALGKDFETIMRADLDAIGRMRHEPMAEAAAPVTEVAQEIAPEVAPAPAAEVVANDIESKSQAIAAGAEVAADEIVKLEKEVIVARSRFYAAKDAVKATRGVVALAIRNWQIVSGAPDAAELHRLHARKELQYRADVASGKVTPYTAPDTTGDSVIDRQAKHGRGGEPGAAYGAFRRGSSTRQGAYVPKVPSQR